MQAVFLLLKDHLSTLKLDPVPSQLLCDPLGSPSLSVISPVVLIISPVWSTIITLLVFWQCLSYLFLRFHFIYYLRETSITVLWNIRLPHHYSPPQHPTCLSICMCLVYLVSIVLFSRLDAPIRQRPFQSFFTSLSLATDTVLGPW